MTTQSQSLNAVVLACTLTPSPGDSSTMLMSQQFVDELSSHGVGGEIIRVVDHDVRPGVETDMGNGDDWPSIRSRLMAADIIVFCTPTWAGHMSSVSQRVVERVNAELSQTKDDGRPSLFDKVFLAGVVGNEDGAHAIVADLYQAMNDCGLTVPAQGCTYWNGEAMHTTDYKDLDEAPEATISALRTAISNAVHLAGLLRDSPFPSPPQS